MLIDLRVIPTRVIQWLLTRGLLGIFENLRSELELVVFLLLQYISITLADVIFTIQEEVHEGQVDLVLLVARD